MRNNEITIALAKGRLAEQCTALLEACGLDCGELKEKNRKLIFYDHANGFRFLLVKPSDVPTYVEHGVADVGIAGKDTLLEAAAPLFEMLDLGLGKCRLCVCGYPRATQDSPLASKLRVASKYPRVAREFFESRGEAVELINLHGSVEIAPMLGLSDVIVDIVESGRTLEENGLTVLESICECSARVVVNRASLKTQREKIQGLIADLRREVQNKESRNHGDLPG